MSGKNTLVGITVLAASLAALQPPSALAWGRFAGGHHPVAAGWAHRDPVVIHHAYVEHRPGPCIGCGAGIAAVAGLVGGAILGAAIAGSAPPAPVVVDAPPPVAYEAPPPVAYAPPPVAYVNPPVGSEVAALPGGCANMNVNGATFYQCGPTWYQPFMGANGVYYSVVPAP